MASTDAKTGFRLPWSSDRSNQNDEPSDTETAEAANDTPWPATDTAQGEPEPAQPAAEPAGQHATPSEGTVSAPFSAAQTPPRKPPAKPTKFLADLTKAMQAAAEAAREQTLTQFQADAKTFVELIHERSAGEATELKSRADADIDGIRTWSKGEIARIREETEARIAARRVELDEQVDRHAGAIERQIEMVHGSVSAFEREMASFFEELLEETDPARFAAMAETMPEPPNFEDILPEAFLVDETRAASVATTDDAPTVEDQVEASVDQPESVDQPQAIAEADEAAATGWTQDGAPEDAPQPEPEAANEQATEPEPAPEAITDAPAEDDGSGQVPGWPSADFDAAEAEAAMAARMESAGDDLDSDDSSFVERLSQLVPSDTHEAAPVEIRSTQVVVVGLVSVASIASFKRHLGRLPGVQAVGVSSGPDGEFVFTVSHKGDVQLRDALPTLPGFGARVTSSGDGVVNVTARDPEAEA
jgi:hypothetical protein